MKTYNTFKRNKIGLLTLEDFEELKIDYGKSITDKTKYNPSAPSFLGNQGALYNNALYHFNDGVDNGLNMALITSKNLDLTERAALDRKIAIRTGEEISKLLNDVESLEQSEKEETEEKASDSSTSSKE